MEDSCDSQGATARGGMIPTLLEGDRVEDEEKAPGSPGEAPERRAFELGTER